MYLCLKLSVASNKSEWKAFLFVRRVLANIKWDFAAKQQCCVQLHCSVYVGLNELLKLSISIFNGGEKPKLTICAIEESTSR